MLKFIEHKVMWFFIAKYHKLTFSPNLNFWLKILKIETKSRDCWVKISRTIAVIVVIIIIVVIVIVVAHSQKVDVTDLV